MNLGIFSQHENKKINRWYSILNFLMIIRNQDFDFLNLGYYPSDIEQNKYSFISKDFKNNISSRQALLYYSLIEHLPKDADTVGEIGSGFGGGAKIVQTYFSPKHYIGFDANQYSIKKCNRKFSRYPNFTFQLYDYRNFNQTGISFDTIISLEASLHFEDVSIFYRNVSTVLKDNGTFFYGDIFEKSTINSIEKAFKDEKLKIIDKRDVTEQVVNSIFLTGKPSTFNHWLHRIFLGNNNLDFSVNTRMYNKLKNREFIYLFYELAK